MCLQALKKRLRRENAMLGVPAPAPGMRSKGRDLRGGVRGGQMGGWRRLPKRLWAVTVGYQCVMGTVAGHRLGALGYLPPPPNASLPLPPLGTHLSQGGPVGVCLLPPPPLNGGFFFGS